jgi:hypothetical protein
VEKANLLGWHSSWFSQSIFLVSKEKKIAEIRLINLHPLWKGFKIDIFNCVRFFKLRWKLITSLLERLLLVGICTKISRQLYPFKKTTSSKTYMKIKYQFFKCSYSFPYGSRIMSFWFFCKLSFDSEVMIILKYLVHYHLPSLFIPFKTYCSLDSEKAIRKGTARRRL